MSEPQLPPKSEPTSADPLLDTGAYIDPAPNHSPAADIPQPGVVIAAEPISYYIPGEAPAEPAPRAARRRDPEERPSWLPENWMIELRRRNSGATAGQTDRNQRGNADSVRRLRCFNFWKQEVNQRERHLLKLRLRLPGLLQAKHKGIPARNGRNPRPLFLTIHNHHHHMFKTASRQIMANRYEVCRW
ncbi:uncharacterized protein LOC121741385 isoform X1 [Salvia splendens]|uniref:uncharacterized protein LOC121741385 isoform X1 n=1 Tax=Salvia splendens TaxID=180675 RepID=UPI001C25C41D|nr:uncharacterized protein LOC121741385 isoform X1 [Salvia splendens]